MATCKTVQDFYSKAATDVSAKAIDVSPAMLELHEKAMLELHEKVANAFEARSNDPRMQAMLR